MGKAFKWFRSIFRSKKPISSESLSPKLNHTHNKPSELKGSIGSAKRSNLDDPEPVSHSSFVEELDANKHAIAVAVATAAVAEAAVAAARAAAEVVRLTSGGSRSRGGDTDRLRELAAIRIQSDFRAYLARRALKALRGLVKLQALVRGRIVRKQSADMLRRMQAMARIQARACATRAHTSDSPHYANKLLQDWHPGNGTSKGDDLQQHPGTLKHEGQNLKHMQKSGSRSNAMNHNVGERKHLPSNWLDRWMEECTWIDHQSASFKHKCGDDEKSDKILEVDTWKPHQNPRRTGKPFQSSQYFSAWNDSAQGRRPIVTDSTNSARYQNPDPSFSSGDVSSIKSLKVLPEADKLPIWTAENSPHVHSASSRPPSSKRRNACSPVRSEGGKSFYGDYLSYPNYMANTESYRAKVRSQSAPKQRLQLDNFTTSRQFVHGPWDSDTRSEKDSALHFNYQTKGYSASPQLSKQRMPVNANSGSIDSR